MSKSQIRLVISMAGMFLLSITVYKWKAFTHFGWTVILFKIFVALSFLMIFYGIGRLLRLPIAACLAIPLLLEIGSWRYIRHVIGVNQSADKQNIGVLDQWVNYRDVIQFNRQFSSYSPDLGYTLRPGSEGYHQDLEYKNKFSVNKSGLRDNNQALVDPKIIFLGDSFTMGWGIDQDKTFAHLTGQMNAAKSLNAGVSSYGTFREMLMLSKLQRDSCKVLVIQYCDNDLEENTARNAPGSSQEPLTLEKFQDVGIFNRLNEGYFPMRFTYFFVREKDLFKRIFTSPGQVWQDSEMAFTSWISGQPMPGVKPLAIKSEAMVAEHTNQFFKILTKIRAIYGGQIIVLHLDGRYTKPELINGFEAAGKKRQDSNLHFLRACDVLTAQDYYPVDGHLNEAGHYKIADELTRIIREKALLK
ncbi:hypothetical protein MUK70_01735 [Dyadobacter chenwenxiniae]|uniref:SGNH hydrolase-type esterase domain-containing protein n=1 Tax=Dyadobacter chenwenxiniae TaxID=2906456 RepID=A0A9X1TLN6_9BACT|nr:hypothetical protein [Dyadobacter chenwenxiniae]MCF0062533.1 hypothetical protein [Dyadobacter chenwenxiniae]UON83723.1 hypothetical protein MUK70_01735 [Dyadobacter chenwenxiniae]